MASKYDPETRAKAVRLVLEHRDGYPSEWAAITAVSKRLGMTARTVPGVGSVSIRLMMASVTAFPARLRPDPGAEAEERRARADHRDPQGGNVFLRAGVRPANRPRSICRVHRRTPGQVRGRTDLPGAERARLPDRPENVLGLGQAGAVEAGPVGRW